MQASRLKPWAPTFVLAGVLGCLSLTSHAAETLTTPLAEPNAAALRRWEEPLTTLQQQQANQVKEAYAAYAEQVRECRAQHAGKAAELRRCTDEARAVRDQELAGLPTKAAPRAPAKSKP